MGWFEDALSGVTQLVTNPIGKIGQMTGDFVGGDTGKQIRDVSRLGSYVVNPAAILSDTLTGASGGGLNEIARYAGDFVGGNIGQDIRNAGRYATSGVQLANLLSPNNPIWQGNTYANMGNQVMNAFGNGTDWGKMGNDVWNVANQIYGSPIGKYYLDKMNTQQTKPVPNTIGYQQPQPVYSQYIAPEWRPLQDTSLASLLQGGQYSGI